MSFQDHLDYLVSLLHGKPPSYEIDSIARKGRKYTSCSCQFPPGTKEAYLRNLSNSQIALMRRSCPVHGPSEPAAWDTIYGRARKFMRRWFGDSK